MAKYSEVPRDMPLYSVAEPKGRVFLKGESWPGDAWSDQPGGEMVGTGTVAQSLKDLNTAANQVNELRAIVESQGHDVAQAARERDEAVARADGLAQVAKDAQAAQAQAEDATKTLTEERDAARDEARQQAARADKLDGDASEANSTLERLVGELNQARQEAADANGLVTIAQEEIAALKADIAKMDGDKDGKVGGKAAKAKPEGAAE